jgi:hypothetical protein
MIAGGGDAAINRSRQKSRRSHRRHWSRTQSMKPLLPQTSQTKLSHLEDIEIKVNSFLREQLVEEG